MVSIKISHYRARSRRSEADGKVDRGPEEVPSHLARINHYYRAGKRHSEQSVTPYCRGWIINNRSPSERNVPQQPVTFLSANPANLVNFTDPLTFPPMQNRRTTVNFCLKDVERWLVWRLCDVIVHSGSSRRVGGVDNTLACPILWILFGKSLISLTASNFVLIFDLRNIFWFREDEKILDN